MIFIGLNTMMGHIHKPPVVGLAVSKARKASSQATRRQASSE